MSRNYDLFPDDENGNVLWQMMEEGNNLSEPHEFEFTLVFNEQSKAEQCALYLLHQEQKVSLFEEEKSSQSAGFWILNTHLMLIPAYSDIEDLEDWFSRIAKEFKGEYDGWGCMSYLYEFEQDDEMLTH